MARNRDLAGLAALAALGMTMANRGSKGGVKADRDVYDREDARMPDAMPAAEEDPMEAANKRTERTLMPNQRGDAGTSETVFPSTRPGGNRPAAAPAKPATNAVPRLIDRTPPVGTGSGGGRGPTAEELAAYKPPSSSKYPDIRGSAANSLAAENRRKIREGSEGLEGVYPEQMIGSGAGVGLKTLHGIAKNLAGRTAAKEAPAAASPFLKELPYSGTKQLPNAPTKQITGPSKGELMARDRAERAAGRNEEMARENARRYGLNPDDMSATTSSLLRKNMGGDDFSLPLKKGGKVKAKGYAMGGAIKSSASSRGDGIATKGKTRGKIC
jgi:hypothetical protein